MKSEIRKTGIVYCRVSAKEQVEGTSLNSQEKFCFEYAKRENVKILNKYIEKGESAKTADRTEFNKALAFCSNKKNKVDFFIVYKIDRFARNQDDHVTVRAMLRKSNTELRSVTEPINESPIGRALEGMLSVFAEFDNNVRTERTKQGMLERLKEGVWVWRAPFGYYRPCKGSNIAPEPEKSRYVRLGFEEYSKGIYTFQGIADFLNKRGARTERQKPISAQFIEKILKNPIYYGFIKQWGGHKGAFEPIISEELFRECRPENIQSVHGSPRSANNPLFPLRKLVCCKECGCSLTGSSSTGRSGKRYPYYHHSNNNCSSSKSIAKDKLETEFKKHLSQITPGPEYEKLFKAIVVDIWKERYKKVDIENAKIQREITVLEAERQKIFNFHRSGRYGDDDFIEQKAFVNERINQKRFSLKGKWDEEFNMDEVLEYCFSFIRTTSKTWEKANYSTKIRFQKMIFENGVEFDGEKFGTTGLKQVYKINQHSRADKSLMVTQVRNSWNQIIKELKEWDLFKKQANSSCL